MMTKNKKNKKMQITPKNDRQNLSFVKGEHGKKWPKKVVCTKVILKQSLVQKQKNVKTTNGNPPSEKISNHCYAAHACTRIFR